MRDFISTHDAPLAAGREQNLLISTSKHLYLTKSGFLRRQQKPIDPRLPGNKILLKRLVILDVDTGTVYGEMHLDADDPDLIGFLARAWSRKTLHPMRGFPRHLNVPKVVMENPLMRGDLSLLQQEGGFTIAPLPAGFAAGIHAVKQFELETESMVWSIEVEAHMELIQAVSAVISRQASSAMSFFCENAWDAVQAPDQAFTTWVDGQYKKIGAWRHGSYELVLDGVPTNDATLQQ